MYAFYITERGVKKGMSIKAKKIGKGFGWGGYMEQSRYGRRKGVLLTACVSVILFLLSLPFFDWIYLTNISALFAKAGITREIAASLYQSYSVFYLLEFVKNSGLGVLGLLFLFYYSFQIPLVFLDFTNTPGQ